MADLDQKSIDKMLEYLRDIAGGRGGGTSSFYRSKTDSSTSTFSKLHKQDSAAFGKSVKGITDSVKLMHGGIDDFTRSLKGLTGIIPVMLGGGVVAGLISGAMDLTKSYNRMADAGQLFGGSMLNMAAQAGASGLSLEQFTNMIEKHSETAAALNKLSGGTTNAMGLLQKQVRLTLSPLGMLGMSMTQVVDASSDLADSMLYSGRLGRLDAQQQGNAVSTMIKDVSLFSEATGKSRAETLKAVNAANKEVTSATIPLTPQQHMIDDKITAFLSALPGGDTLAMMHKQMVGAQGISAKSALANPLRATGADVPFIRLQQMVMNGKASDEQMVGAIEEFVKITRANIPRLVALAQGGDAGAQKQLDMMLEFEKMGTGPKLKASIENSRKQQGIQEANTKAMLTLESRFHMITGGFVEGFYGTLDQLSKAFTIDDSSEAGIQQFSQIMKSLGAVVGSVLSVFLHAFTGVDTKSFANTIIDITDWLNAWQLNGGPKRLADCIQLVLHDVWSAFKWIWEHLGDHTFLEDLAQFGHGVSMVIHALVSFADFLVNNRLMRLMTGMKDNASFDPSKPVSDTNQRYVHSEGGPNVSAAEVLAAVAGTAVVGAKGGRLISKLQQGRAAKAAAKIATKGALEVGEEIGVKSIVKSGAKFVPGLGLILGSVFAAQKAAGGDYIGAGLELASGVASTLPGYGTAAAVGLQGVIIGRDIANAYAPATPGEASPDAAPSDGAEPTDPITKLVNAIGVVVPGQPTLLIEIATLVETMKELVQLTTSSNEMMLASLALQNQGNELADRMGMRMPLM